MNTRHGSRPWPVIVFCLTSLASGLFDLVAMLTDIDMLRAELALAFPDIAVTRDHAIVAASAIFTIVLIPIVAIGLFASRVARTLVTIAVLLMTGPLIVSALTPGFETRTDIVSFALAFLSFASVAGLWMPAARTWFEQERRVEPAVFE